MIHFVYIGQTLTRNKLLKLGYKKTGNWDGVFGGAVLNTTKEKYKEYKKLGYQVFKLIPNEGEKDLLKWYNEKSGKNEE